MKILPINQVSNKLKTVKNFAPLVAATIMTVGVAANAKTNNEVNENKQAVPAALAIASVVPLAGKRKENGIEMISEDFIKIRKGKYLTEEEIQAYKNKWNLLNENNLITENNKYIAHNLCQNTNIDEVTALNSLKQLAEVADERGGLNESPKTIVKNCNIIINSDKIDNKDLPNVLSTVRSIMGEHDINAFLKNADFVIENIKPDCYKNFMDYYSNEREKLDPRNYKDEKVTDEMVSKFESIKKGRSEARRLVHDQDCVKAFSFNKTNGYYWGIRDALKTFKFEIETFKKQGLGVSDIAQRLNTTEDGVNALEYVIPSDLY